MMNDSFRRDFRNIVDYLAGNHAASEVNAYADRIQDRIDDCLSELHKITVNGKEIKWAKGDLAEAWHAGTFNIDATRQGVGAWAETPRNQSPIDIVVRDNQGAVHYQSKYHQDPQTNLNALSQEKYLDTKGIVPEGHATDGVGDRIAEHGVESKPLSEPNSRELVEQLRKNDVDRERWGLTVGANLQWRDIFHEATTAGTRAAVMGMALQIAPALITIAKKAWDTGEITTKDFAPMIRSIPATLLRSGVAGGLSAAIMGAIRKCDIGAAQQVHPTLVAAGVVLAIGALGTSVKAARGDISWPVAAKTISEDAIVLAASMGGAVAGQVLIPALGLGALAGNIIGAALARLAIDQANRVILGIAGKTDWTVFGLVDQNYTVPREVLEDSGWMLVDIRKFEPQIVRVRRVQLRTIELRRIGMSVLRRGVISFGNVGYMENR